MPSVTTTYYGVEGTGKNVTEAKKNASEKIKDALDGSYQPKMLQSRGWAIIVWRDPHGWHSNTIMQDGVLREDGFQCYSSGSRDFYVEYASAILNLAQITWDGSEQRPPCLDEVSTINSRHTVNDNAGRRLLSEFASWRGFQLAYKHAKANGIGQTDNEWHRWACENTEKFAA